MSTQPSFYGVDGTSTKYPQSKVIATKQHVGIFVRQISDGLWIRLSPDVFDLQDNTVSLADPISGSLYNQIEVRVVDEFAELGDNASDTAIVASISDEVVIVAGISDEVVSVSDNNANVTLVGEDLAKGLGTNQPTDSAILNALTNATQTILDAASTADDVVSTGEDVVSTDASATQAELDMWESEANSLTSKSYAEEAENVPVNIVTSDGDGTFTYTPTNPAEYSSLHYSLQATPTTFASLSDTNFIDLEDDDGVKYDLASGKWLNVKLGITDTPILDISSKTQPEGIPYLITVTNDGDYTSPVYSVTDVTYVDNSDGTITITPPAFGGTNVYPLDVTCVDGILPESLPATHTLTVQDVQAATGIIIQDATLNDTTIPTTPNATITASELIADADDAVSETMKYTSGNTNLNLAPTMINTAKNFILEGTPTNLEVIVSGQTLTDGDEILINDGASTALAGFNTTGHVTDSTPTVVIDPASKGSNLTLSNGDLTVTVTGTQSISNSNCYSDLIINSGNVYFEVTIDATTTGSTLVGINANNTEQSNGFYQFAGSVAYYDTGTKFIDVSNTAYGDTYTTGDVIGARYSYVTGEIEFYKNGVSQGVAHTLTPNTSMYPASNMYANGTTHTYNYGATAFSSQPLDTTKIDENYTIDITTASLTSAPTTVVKATSSLRTSCVDTGLADSFVARTAQSHTADDVGGVVANDEFETVLFVAGTTTVPMANIIGGVDFVWAKNRDLGYNHRIGDSLRGVEKNLDSSTTDAESTSVQNVTTFGSNSFTHGKYGSGDTDNMVAWCASLPIDNASNTDGTITSVTKNNSFMSAVSYTGDGVNATIGHSLGVVPELVIYKGRTIANNWAVYNKTIGASKYLYLNTTVASTATTTYFNDIAPTSTVLSVGTSAQTNELTHDYIAYAFASVAGKCKVGSYTGTGASNSIDVGFEPAWVMIKCTSGVGNWIMIDSQRTNGTIWLYADTAEAEIEASTYTNLETNGFTVKTTLAGLNASGATYIYLAIAKDYDNTATTVTDIFDTDTRLGEDIKAEFTQHDTGDGMTSLVIDMDEVV